MIHVSDAFHEAIANGRKQRILLHYLDRDVWFTSSDVELSSVDFSLLFNSEEDACIGLTPSAQVQYNLINDDGYLNDFQFGKHNVYLGVDTENFKFIRRGNVSVDYQGVRIDGYTDAPYLRVGDDAFPVQPEFSIDAMLVKGNVLYCFSRNSRIAFIIEETDATIWADLGQVNWNSQSPRVWSDYDGAFITRTQQITDDIQWHLIQRMIDTHTGAVMNTPDHTITTYSNGVGIVTSYVQKGVYWAERPQRVKVNLVDVTAYDGMDVLVDIPATGVEVTWPITLEDLKDAVCEAANIETVGHLPVNGDWVVREPRQNPFEYYNFREIIHFIAEASASTARFNHEGKLEFVWFEESGLTITEHDYEEFSPFEYTVHQIDAVQIRNSDSDIGVIYNEGTNVYIIQENPFLEFESDEEGQPVAEAIYDVLHALGEYIPGTLRWFSDWTYEPGDIVSVIYKGGTYRFPIFTDDIDFSGMSMSTLECTGREYRETLTRQQRGEYRTGKKLFEIDASIDGLNLHILDLTREQEELESTVSLTAQGLAAEIRRASQAEGDLETNISVTASQIMTQVSRTYVTQESADQNYVSNVHLQQNYYTKTETTSQIIQASDRITQNISQTYYNKTQMDTTVQDLSDRIAQSGTHTYVQLDPPSNPGIGDLWVKANPARWEAVRTSTWGDLQTEKWGEIGGGTSAPEMYVWTGEAWLDTNVQADFSTLEEEIETVQSNLDQTASSIRAEVASVRTITTQNTGSINSLSRTVSENKSSIEQTASEISARVDSVTTDVTDLSRVVSSNYSELSQRADGITLTVEGMAGNMSDLDSKVERYKSSIDQRANSIELNVTSLGNTVSQQQATLSVMADQISSKVSAGDIASSINQTAQAVKIQASKIQFEGLVTANQNFKILSDGSVEAKNGSFSGSMTAGNWTFTQDGSRYTNGDIAVNMTVLTGGADMVGGGSDYRAFYGSSGCDVQYGADYNNQTIIRSKVIKIISQVGSVSDFRSAEFKKIPGANDMTFVCGESTGNRSGSSAGNLGCEAQAWDTAWIRSIRYYTQSAYSARALKHNIHDMPEMGDIIDLLKPVTFAYNGEEKLHNGLIYEDTEKVYPLICQEPAKDGNEMSQYGSINYMDLIPVLLRELQSVRNRVKSLEVNRFGLYD